MKHTPLLSLLLCLALLAGLLSGCGSAPAKEPAETPDDASETVPLSGEAPEDEYQRALWYGFIPDDMASADPDAAIVSWAQFCAVIGRVIQRHDSGAPSASISPIPRRRCS